jgi:hypothetical protein
MGYITLYRGRLVEYAGPFDESMLVSEVTLDEFLAERYTPFLLERCPEQARADWARERAALEAVIEPGDSLWQWQRVEALRRTDGSVSESGGLALRRAGQVVRVWLVWRDH